MINNELMNKKILVLGGTRYACEIVNIAHKNNMIVYVADYKKDSPAKKIADKSFLVDIKNIDDIVKICIDEHIDGVIFTVLDFIFPYYYEICKRSNLYCYGTKKQFEILQNKSLFKKYCKKYGVDVIPEYEINEVITGDSIIQYPVIIKPVDGSASRGITICYNDDDLKRGLLVAKEYAINNKREDGVIVEKYIDYHHCNDFIAHYIIINGKIFTVLTGDRYVIQANKYSGSITSAVVYPSIYSNDYFNKAHKNISNFINKLEIKNGILFIQMFYDGNKFYCYDPGFRTGGAEVFRFSQKIYGYNQLEMLIKFAVTGKMCDENNLVNEFDYKFPNKIACNLAVMLKPGKIKTITGTAQLEKISEIINITTFLQEGDIVTEIGTLAQTLFRIHIVARNTDELINIIKKIRDSIKVVDSYGNDMIVDIFNAEEELCERANYKYE